MSSIVYSDGKFKLERNIFDKKSYYYLSKKNSELYDCVKDSDDPKDKVIKELILEIGQECMNSQNIYER